MKTFLLVLAAVSVSGCAVYPAYPVAPGYAGYGTSAAPAYVDQPAYLYGAGVYRYGGYPSPYVYPYPHFYPRGYHHVYPGGFSGYGSRPFLHAPRPGYGGRNHGGMPHGFGQGHGRAGRK